jgi:hypothetical protein
MAGSFRVPWVKVRPRITKKDLATWDLLLSKATEYNDALRETAADHCSSQDVEADLTRWKSPDMLPIDRSIRRTSGRCKVYEIPRFTLADLWLSAANLFDAGLKNMNTNKKHGVIRLLRPDNVTLIMELAFAQLCQHAEALKHRPKRVRAKSIRIVDGCYGMGKRR